MDEYNRKIEERQEQNIPMDDYGRTFHEQDEDFAIVGFIIICLVAVGLLVWRFIFS